MGPHTFETISVIPSSFHEFKKPNWRQQLSLTLDSTFLGPLWNALDSIVITFSCIVYIIGTQYQNMPLPTYLKVSEFFFGFLMLAEILPRLYIRYSAGNSSHILLLRPSYFLSILNSVIIIVLRGPWTWGSKSSVYFGRDVFKIQDFLLFLLPSRFILWGVSHFGTASDMCWSNSHNRI